MKKVLIILAIIFLFGLAGSFYYFLVYKPSQETDSTLIVRDDQDTQQVDTESDTEEQVGEEGCPEGVVCIGGDEVASLPTIELGVNQVYAAEEDSQESSGDSEEDSTEESGSTTSSVMEDNTPLHVTVTNKDFKTWSVVWVTQKAQTGYLNIGTNSDEVINKRFDDREANVNNLAERFTHHVTITNSGSELTQEDLTYYFTIVSDGEEFKNGDEPYSYENAPLTTSPSTPSSVTVSSSSIAGYGRDDFIVIAKQMDSRGNESSQVSEHFNDTGGVELVIGIAREADLERYFPYSTSNDLQVKVFGPDGYTGFVDSVTLSELEDEVLDIQTRKTGYEGDMYAVAYSTDYALQASQESPIPSTAIGDSWAYNSLFGVLISLFGACCLLLLFYLNYRRIWEMKVIKRLEKEDKNLFN